MSHESNPKSMDVDDLARRCAQETDLYFTRQDHDSRFCFELFRRAIQNGNERALELIIVQYTPLVARWVEKWTNKHPDVPMFHDETQDFIAQAFERFWVSFTPDKFDKSPNLPAVLRYLQMCVYGAMTDAWRKLRRLQIEQDAGEAEQEISDSQPTPEDRLQADEFWQLIKKKCKDPKEYVVVYASFHLDLSPREILAEYSKEFRDIKEIYQYKANILDRLGRDDEFREFGLGV